MRSQDNDLGCAIAFCVYGILYVVLPITLWFFSHEIYKNLYFLYAIIILSFICSIIFFVRGNKMLSMKQKLEGEILKLKREHDKKITSLTKEFKKKKMPYYIKWKFAIKS